MHGPMFPANASSENTAFFDKPYYIHLYDNRNHIYLLSVFIHSVVYLFIDYLMLYVDAIQ